MKSELLKRILSSIILIPIAFFFVIKGSFYFNFFIFICFLVAAYEWHKMKKKNIHFYSGLFFLIFSFYTVYICRIEDYILFTLVLITCIATDIGGYIFGKIFKGPKLIKISPNKTYSGMIGGFFTSIISANFFLHYTPSDSDIELPGKMSIEIFVFVILISLVSQIGDLIISYFKRLSKVKNTGKIIPGHGGLLDRIDGMIFAFPFTYFYLFI